MQTTLIWAGYLVDALIILFLKKNIYRRSDELRRDAVDALSCLAHALGEDFTIFIPSIRKILLKLQLQVIF